MEELCQEGTDRESSEFPEKPRGKDHFSSWNHLCGQPPEIRGKSPRDVRKVGFFAYGSYDLFYQQRINLPAVAAGIFTHPLSRMLPDFFLHYVVII